MNTNHPSTSDHPPMLLTEPQAAAVLAITVRQLRTLRKQKLIPFVKLGRFPRFNPRALEAAVNKLTVNAKGCLS